MRSLLLAQRVKIKSLKSMFHIIKSRILYQKILELRNEPAKPARDAKKAAGLQKEISNFACIHQNSSGNEKFPRIQISWLNYISFLTQLFFLINYLLIPELTLSILLLLYIEKKYLHFRQISRAWYSINFIKFSKTI